MILNRRQLNGRGKYYDIHGNLYFIGTFRDNRFEGPNCQYLFTNNMIRYKGGAWNGLFEGKGREFHKNGKMKARGEFEKGRPTYKTFNVELNLGIPQ